MIEMEHRHEIEPGSPEDIADKLITTWETNMVFTDKPADETKSLGRMILDCLAAERLKRNEKYMSELVSAITSKMDNIVLRNDEVDRQIKEALRHLNNAYEEFKSIEKI